MKMMTPFTHPHVIKKKPLSSAEHIHFGQFLTQSYYMASEDLKIKLEPCSFACKNSYFVLLFSTEERTF